MPEEASGGRLTPSPRVDHTPQPHSQPSLLALLLLAVPRCCLLRPGSALTGISRVMTGRPLMLTVCCTTGTPLLRVTLVVTF